MPEPASLRACWRSGVACRPSPGGAAVRSAEAAEEAEAAALRADPDLSFEALWSEAERAHFLDIFGSKSETCSSWRT